MSKYKAVKTIVDGIEFPSKKEARRWVFLRNLERTGQIRDLKRQVGFELIPSFRFNGKRIRAIKYVADFVYIAKDRNGNAVKVVEDAKGYETDVYKLKKKLFLYRYGFEITEV